MVGRPKPTPYPDRRSVRPHRVTTPQMNVNDQPRSADITGQEIGYSPSGVQTRHPNRSNKPSVGYEQIL